MGAYQLEEFVREAMREWGDGDPDHLAGFSKIWRELPQMKQLNLLGTFVSKVVYDPVAETIHMEFNENEIKAFLDHQEDVSS